MKPFRSILVTALLTITVFSAIMYTACHKDKCKDVVCMNKGACDGGKCFCLPGYEGPKCDTLSRNKLIYTFNGGDYCGDSAKYAQHPLHFLTVPYKPLEVNMKNMLGDPRDSATCTMQGTDSFTFIGSNSSTTYNGWGTFRDDTLKLLFEVRHDTTSYVCKYIGGHF
jgi:hypothetical protein